jgi:hypothetical protein
VPKVWRTGVKASRMPERLAPIVLLPVLLGQFRPLPVQRQVRRSVDEWSCRASVGVLQQVLGGVEADPGLVGQGGDPFGPRTAGRAWSMVGRRTAATTGTPSTATLPEGTWARWTATIGTATTSESGRTWEAWSPSKLTARRVAVRGSGHATAARTHPAGGGLDRPLNQPRRPLPPSASNRSTSSSIWPVRLEKLRTSPRACPGARGCHRRPPLSTPPQVSG